MTSDQASTPVFQTTEISYLDGLHANAEAFEISELFAKNPKDLIVVITKDSTNEERIFNALSFITPVEDHNSVMRLSPWETLPYDLFSPHQDIISERLSTLNHLLSERPGVVILSAPTAMQKVAPVNYLLGSSFTFVKGGQLQLDRQKLILEGAGYLQTDIVSERGQYASRGSILDLFPMGSEFPIRLDLFDDEIETIRSFDPVSQLTIENLDQFAILPAKEFPFDEDAIKKFRENWHNNFQGDVRRCSVYQDVSNYMTPNGIEFFLPFFFDETASIFDYMKRSSRLIIQHGVEEAGSNFRSEVDLRWESLRHDIERPILPPEQLYLDIQELESEFSNFPVIKINEIDSSNTSPQKSHQLPSLRSKTKSDLNETEVVNFVSKASKPILFSCSSEGRREILDSKLLKLGIKTSIVSEFADYLAANTHCITVSPITEGIWNDKVIVLTENELYGTKPIPNKSFANKIIDPEQIIQNLNELSIGAPVVHLEHGIGRYMGLELLEIEGVENEYLTLAYAGSAKLYVPVASLHLISRYAGADEEQAPLHRLGSSQWAKAKRKAAEKIVDVAAELLQAYATREAKKSASLSIDAEDLERFSEEFSFELTQDQQLAIEAVLNDLQSDKAMDRLVCGDVGFGKTEVAMRAALVAVKAGKQVVILVPTTLLAQQHYDTLKDRFAQWPFIIELVSRLRSKSEVDEVALGCASGKVDIVVGTHKLFGEEFKFKDLGLVVIDEEHRFGVRQKELMRAFRAQADVLTLTATPIPRTLNMSLGGIRDLSIIATPPAKRLSIKTFVQEKRSDLIKEAINRELMRGGQVFFVHNEVKTIELIAQTLSEQVTEARIGVGHGQMPKKQLEQVMGDFYQRKLNVLVCTTIIENGIDIPNANTIIIDRADKFGLAQLHQLRGRVGRSSRQAYAYLLTPEPEALTADATKRLDAIEAAGELGIGFTLATQDMEIRGAGQLLGEEQSGQMESIGFSLYMQMLNKAVEDINQGKIPDLDNPLNEVAKEINLHCSAIIPDTYLPDVRHRLMFYKRLASAKTENELDALQIEMIDRFGVLPEALKRLFVISTLKLLCQSHGMQTVEIGQEKGKLVFADTTTINPLSIVKLVQEDSDTYQFEGTSTLITNHQLDSFEDRTRFLEELIIKLTNSSESVSV